MDRQTDGRAIASLACCMLSRAKKANHLYIRCSTHFLFAIYLGVESHMECIKLSLQLSDLIILFISKKDIRIIVFSEY